MEKKRASMLEEMTPEQQEFLRAGKPATPPDPQSVSSSENGQASQPVSMQVSKHTNIQPEETMVTFSVRMRKSLVNKIKEAAFRRKMASLPPASQQEIAEAAFELWLAQNQ